MDIQTAKHIQEIIGLAHLNVSFKVHNASFKSVHGLVDGLTTTYTDNTFTIEFVNDSSMIHTVLHELSHAQGNFAGNGLSCGECDEIADNLLDYVTDVLG